MLNGSLNYKITRLKPLNFYSNTFKLILVSTQSFTMTSPIKNVTVVGVSAMTFPTSSYHP